MKKFYVFIGTLLALATSLFLSSVKAEETLKTCTFFLENSSEFYQNGILKNTKYIEQIKTTLAAKGYTLTDKYQVPGDHWIFDKDGYPAELDLEFIVGPNMYTRKTSNEDTTLLSAFFTLRSHYRKTDSHSTDDFEFEETDLRRSASPRKSLFGTSVDLKYKDHYKSNYDEALENLFKQIPNCNEAKEKLIAMDAQKPKYRYFEGTIETSFADHFPLVSQAKCLVAQKRAFEEAAKAGLTKEQCKLNRIGLFQFGDPAFSACKYSNTGYPDYPREYLNAEVFCQFN